MVGVGSVVIDGRKVLLVRRARAPLAGEWSLPGGLVEVGESLRRALRREIAEETGLRVQVGEILAILDRITRDRKGRVQYHFVLLDFLCRLNGGKLRAASDAAEAKWVLRKDLTNYKLRAATLRVIELGFEATKRKTGNRAKRLPVLGKLLRFA